MLTSVVMTTYNGEKYLVEQLDSLRLQTLPADEVLIFDDCSLDHTVEILNAYVASYNLTNWKISVNEKNKGWNKNFLDGMMHARGDIIFLCDQDDIWEHNKIACISKCFENPNVMVCAHDTVFFDANGEGDYKMVNRSAAKGRLRQYDFVEKAKRICDNGYTLAVRKAFRNEMVPQMLKIPAMSFDDGLATAASVHKQYYVLELPLVHHRIHQSNSSTKHWTVKSRLRDIDRQIASRQIKRKRVAMYLQCYEQYLSANQRKQAADFVNFMEKRISYLQNRQLFRCALQTLHYNPFNDWKFLLTDIFCILTNRKK